MPALTALVHGSIPRDDDGPRSLDPLEVGAGRRDDRVEAVFRTVDDLGSALPCLLHADGIRLDDDDLPAGELQWPRVDAGEAELEHPSRPVSQELEDPWRRGGGKAGGSRCTSETLTFGYRGALTRLRSHPSNLIRVMPAKGVRWFHAASRLRAPTPADGPGSRPT